MFYCQSVWVSECLGVWVSGCLSVWVSECQSVRVSECLSVGMSECQSVWVSECISVWACECVSVWQCECVSVIVCECLTVFFPISCSVSSDSRGPERNSCNVHSAHPLLYVIHWRPATCHWTQTTLQRNNLRINWKFSLLIWYIIFSQKVKVKIIFFSLQHVTHSLW